jgi:hypothetical protein
VISVHVRFQSLTVAPRFQLAFSPIPEFSAEGDVNREEHLKLFVSVLLQRMTVGKFQKGFTMSRLIIGPVVEGYHHFASMYMCKQAKALGLSQHNNAE